LARDLKELHQKFIIESITPLDMFPQTAEIEVAASLQLCQRRPEDDPARPAFLNVPQSRHHKTEFH